MRVAVYHRPGELGIEERPVPEVGPHDVLLEVSHCGVCGSDIHFVLEGWGRPGSVEGHEYAGRVVAVGDAVTDWRSGDAVVGGPSPRCGTCEYCQAGRPSLCIGRNTPGMSVHSDGAFAEYTLVPETSLRRVPDGMSAAGRRARRAARRRAPRPHPAAGCGPGSGCSSPGPGPSAPSASPRHAPGGSPTSW